MVVSKDKFKVREGVFDSFTIKTLQFLDSKGFFELEELSPLFLGKESNVFIGKGNNGHVAIKIYRLENCDFNKMYDYIKLDSRFKGVKRKKRDIIFMWVQREFRNLMKARQKGVRVPTPLAIRNNVIIMDLVGAPASKVKDDLPKNVKKFYLNIISQMKKLLSANLVHADLSQFNILNHNDLPVFIDFSQSTTKDSLRAREYLERDLKNVNNFFKKIGLKEKELKTVEDLL
ncbi:serine protein kinase RIO [Candidatus Woesearchaeota archaeon]|jgi:RIO kinase 1|nr:serine protein kinase RIO [Candidatus Woesearchaeota archaeon]MBT4368801.1 serine protein kinase RIO [Candidatus Woesearchaeota archaeon]MBT4712090.1 serine protein kinase RIO [Candidatus Woesearchaeota archaeon]MBT6639162.1 serine protein kinase RIO [Candidatus Woesearchaeota archaeon]MBT7134362.1 serine protein kinase RIO [Candidatus Woesearchaeota archaeon]